jgi:uncharacterized protein (DUF169 family)
MDEMRLLQEKIGGRWVGITFSHDSAPKENLAKRPMRLCEAIKESDTTPIVLTRHLLNCPGAQRSLGWMTKDDEKIARKMVESSGIKLEIARKVLASRPRLEEGIESILIGTDNPADIIISYAQPEAAMKLVRRWQQLYGADLQLEVSSMMAICGGVTVRAYTTGRICMSFGCPDSRRCGAIGGDRLAIGLPLSLVQGLF